jgi:hypothetical protein
MAVLLARQARREAARRSAAFSCLAHLNAGACAHSRLKGAINNAIQCLYD